MVNIVRHTLTEYFERNLRIIWALVLRELATRYGRNNLGFLWIIGEPLLFTSGVLVMWSIIRPPYDHGIRLLIFVVTGYMPLTLIRHTVGHGINCIPTNINLLYHRKITLLHFFIARTLLEIIGVSLAFFVTVSVFLLFGVISLPPSLSLVLGGWFILSWICFGMTLILGGVAGIYESFEKVANLLTYVMVPMTGTFFMIDWLPYQYQKAVELIPLINCVEMVRAGFFGEFVPTHYNAAYAIAWAAGFTFVGLLVLQFVRDRIDVE